MGKFVKDQKVVALTLEGLAPCTVVRVGWIFIMVQVDETKHLYSLTKGKITSIEEDKHYLLEESFDEEGVYDIGRVFGAIETSDLEVAKKLFNEDTELKKYETFHNPTEGKLYEGQYYTTIKTGKELIEQYFNRQGLERNGTN
ncbi:hypothetical protein ACMZ5A_02660 [Bacillus mobilis]|uniref:hypothetical protein n=1 Tax=Bacillus mobilis TaxID=2026190 RepID=UPI0035DC3482